MYSCARAANSLTNTVTHFLYFFTRRLKSLHLQNYVFHCPHKLLNPKHHLVKSRSDVRLRMESYSELREKSWLSTKSLSHSDAFRMF